jgi:hypothetical protein
MMKLNLTKALLFIVSLVTISSLPPPVPAQVLQGGVKETNTLNNSPKPGSNINAVTDPFGETQAPTQPPPSFALTTKHTAPSKKPFDLDANNNAAEANESSPAMKIAWNDWHKRVATNVFLRFSAMAKEAFPDTRPMNAAVAYTVTNDGHILNARLTAVDTDELYNLLCLTAVNSLNGNLEVLQFPKGSRRTKVDKSGTFCHNSGSDFEAFKTIQGDDETVHQR